MYRNPWRRMLGFNHSTNKLQQWHHVHHIQWFVNLWTLLCDVHLNVDNSVHHHLEALLLREIFGDICLSCSIFGFYVFHHEEHCLDVWTPLKFRFFAWLIIQDRLWTADHLQRLDWPIYGLCPLCNKVQESLTHLLFKCCFSLRIWHMSREWLGLSNST